MERAGGRPDELFVRVLRSTAPGDEDFLKQLERFFKKLDIFNLSFPLDPIIKFFSTRAWSGITKSIPSLNLFRRAST